MFDDNKILGLYFTKRRVEKQELIFSKVKNDIFTIKKFTNSLKIRGDPLYKILNIKIRNDIRDNDYENPIFSVKKIKKSNTCLIKDEIYNYESRDDLKNIDFLDNVNELLPENNDFLDDRSQTRFIEESSLNESKNYELLPVLTTKNEYNSIESEDTIDSQMFSRLPETLTSINYIRNTSIQKELDKSSIKKFFIKEDNNIIEFEIEDHFSTPMVRTKKYNNENSEDGKTKHENLNDKKESIDNIEQTSINENQVMPFIKIQLKSFLSISDAKKLIITYKGADFLKILRKKCNKKMILDIRKISTIYFLNLT